MRKRKIYKSRTMRSIRPSSLRNMYSVGQTIRRKEEN